MGVDELFGGDEQAQPEPEAPEPVLVEEAVDPQPEPQTPVEPEPEQPEAQTRHVPINALLDERDKRKDLERRLAEAERRNQPQPQQLQVPDPFDDAPGFLQAQQRMMDERVTGIRFEMSDRFARQQHGDEAVQNALNWATERAQAEPAFAAQYMAQQDPIGFIVQQHKRDAFVAEVGDDRDAYMAKWAADNGYTKQSAPVPAMPVGTVPEQAAAPARVPRSLASKGSAPSDIRHTATGPLAGVDALFN